MQGRSALEKGLAHGTDVLLRVHCNGSMGRITNGMDLCLRIDRSCPGPIGRVIRLTTFWLHDQKLARPVR